MAENRMFLLHRPSGLAVALGKRAGAAWHVSNRDVGVDLTALFERVGEGDYDPDAGVRDDFCMAMENADEIPFAVEYKYAEHLGDGLYRLRLR